VTVRLSIRTATWRAHVAQVAAGVDGLVPVVKGNGYGFGRTWLAGVAAELSDTIAVGTVHELDALPAGVTAVVLTPTLSPPTDTGGAGDPVLTVGRREHVEALAGWTGRVLVKLASPMRRYGGEPDDHVAELARERGLDVVGVSIHPPLTGAPGDRRAEVVERLAQVDPDLPVWLSHLEPEVYAALPAAHRYRLRLGTSLWLGDRAALHLDADVLDVRRVRAGETAGYRLTPVGVDGHLVMIGAGTANGVTALPDGRSPFHFGRRRMPLHEPPHMHTSMVLVATGDPLPTIGDRVDLQRPLTMTAVDRYDWI
jgi:alanine racemase